MLVPNSIYTSDHSMTLLSHSNTLQRLYPRFSGFPGFSCLNAGLPLLQSCNCAVWASVLPFLGGWYTQRLLARATTREVI